MASTYENDLRLEEMATGENSGSWGTKTNTNLELIADAFSYGTEIIADADTTITIADGAADAARSLALKINSSADLTTTRTITLAPNTTSKVWIIENNTSGGQTLTISAGSGSNITLANGTTKIIATDGIGAGSNVVELTQDIAIADMSVDGILKVDTIDELTAAAGVTVEGVVLKDGGATVTADINFGDNDKAIFGAGSDLQIYHDGATSRIEDINGANLILRSSADVRIDKYTGENMGVFNADGSVDLYYDNSKKLATTATGIDVSDAATNEPTIQLKTATAANFMSIARDSSTGHYNFTAEETGSSIQFFTDPDGTGADKRLTIDRYGDITFYETDGTTASFVYDASAGTTFNEAGNDRDFRVESDGQTHMLFVDASTNRVGINNNAPQAFLHVTSGDGSGAFRVEQTNPSASGNAWQSLFEDDSSADQGSGNSMIYINSNRPNTSVGKVLRVIGNGKVSEYFSILDTGEVVVNNSSLSTADFRVESDSTSHALFVDAGNNAVGLMTSSTTSGRGDVGVGGMMFFEPGGIAFDTTNPRPTLKRGGDGAFQIAAGSDSSSKVQLYTAPSSGGVLVENFTVMPDGEIRTGGDNSASQTLNFRTSSTAGRSVIKGIKRTDSGSVNAMSQLQLMATGTNSYIGQFKVVLNGTDTYNSTNQQNCADFRGDSGLVLNQSGYANLDFRVESDSNANAFVVDAGTSIVRIGAGSDVANNSQPKLSVTTPWKASSSTDYDGTLSLVATGGGSSGGRGPQIIFTGEDGSSARTLAKIDAIKENSTSGDHDGALIFRTRKNGSSLPARLHLLSYAAIFNDDSDDTDFIVESDNQANMLVVDAGADVVMVGTNSPSSPGQEGLKVGDGWTYKSYYFSFGASRTVTFSGEYNYQVEITAMVTPNTGAIGQSRFIAGRRDFSGASHCHATADIVNTTADIAVSTSDSSQTRSYTLTIDHGTDGANVEFLIEVKSKNVGTVTVS